MASRRSRSSTSPGSAAVRLEEQRADRSSGRGRCRRPRPSRSCRRGRRRSRQTNEVLPDVLAAALLPVLEGHLQRDLDRGRAGVRVEDAGQPGRRDLDQAAGQLGGAGMGEAEHRRVRDAVRAGRAPPRRSPGAGGRGRCTRARRRRRGSAAPRCRSGRVPRPPRSSAALPRTTAPLLRERVPEVVAVELGQPSSIRLAAKTRPAGRMDSGEVAARA